MMGDYSAGGSLVERRPLGGHNKCEVLYRTRHLCFVLPPFRCSSAARVACSNTSLTPSLVLAEHSRYLYAPIFLRTSSPFVVKIGQPSEQILGKVAGPGK